MSTICQSPGILAVAGSLPALLTPSHSPQGQGGECSRTRSPARACSNLWGSPLATPRVRARGPSGRHPSQPLPGRPGLTTPASTTGALRENKSGGPPPKAWLARPLGLMPYHGVFKRVWGTGWVYTASGALCLGLRGPAATDHATPHATKHPAQPQRPQGSFPLSHIRVHPERSPQGGTPPVSLSVAWAHHAHVHHLRT